MRLREKRQQKGKKICERKGVSARGKVVRLGLLGAGRPDKRKITKKIYGAK